MISPRFTHIRARTRGEALAAATKSSHACFVAGGTDLLGILKDRVHGSRGSELLVDLKTISGLSFVREEGGRLTLGALTSIAEIAASQTVREGWPLLARAAASVASPQLRNMGTLGGNICQEPRCWYYRYPDDRFHCLRKGGRECAALLGENRFHSVFGSARVGLPSCSDECPGGVSIPSYMAEIRSGDLAAAARILLRNNPMPAVTGRVCPHYCEQACNRNQLDDSVSIRAVERSMGDFVLENATALYEMTAPSSGKRVAVVGSGPAGLAAAFYLRRAGHEVRVFDRMREAGGMLRYSIPAYRLPSSVLNSLIASYEGAGVVFELASDVGSAQLPLEALRKGHDAVFLASGAWEQKTVEIEGSELLESGIDFLERIREGAREPAGENVLVIGGGNVAVDVAISAMRLGARTVTMACLESRSEMPAFPEELEQALREGVRLLPSWGPKRLVSSLSGLEGMELVACGSVFDSKGRFAPVFDEARPMRVAADRVILAIGQAPELGYLGGALEPQRGRIVADPATQATSEPGLFAGGDATTGPASVVAAIAAGRRAAEAIDASLGGPLAGRPVSGLATSSVRPVRAESIQNQERQAATEIPVSMRGLDAEDLVGLDARAVAAEAGRCMDCGCVAVNASDLAPALLALGASIQTDRRLIAAEDFFAVKPRGTTVLEDGELVTELKVPAQGEGAISAYRKFRLRNSIDFPIVSLASLIVLKGGRIESARIAFGAVSPLPLRARGLERFLLGRAPDAETAEAAADMAARGAFPLERNAYKLQILKGLVKKTILELETGENAKATTEAQS